VLPYFIRAEAREEGGNEYRGAAGKLQTCYGTLRNPLHAAWLEAAREAGYPPTPDVNGFQQEGFGRMDMTVGHGRRCSAANAYLRPRCPVQSEGGDSCARDPHRLRGASRRALEYSQGGGTRRVEVNAEVILCGGPINSPQLLKLSGVGPAAELRSLGIDVVHDVPGVGRTFRITSNSTSRSPARSPSRCIRRSIFGAAR